jgi:hypothetical protein
VSHLLTSHQLGLDDVERNETISLGNYHLCKMSTTRMSNLPALRRQHLLAEL